MSIKQTAQIGESVIRQKSEIVKNVSTRKVRQIIKDLVDSMRHADLVGMAAPQIGEDVRIFVSEIRRTAYRKDLSKSEPLRVFINPKIVWHSRKQVAGYEGCGSVASAGLFGSVKRSQSVICEALNENGKPFKIKASGLLARVIQHETDHLNGIVFIDRVSDTKKLMGRDAYVNSRKK
jgi:peptide deformylase